MTDIYFCLKFNHKRVVKPNSELPPQSCIRENMPTNSGGEQKQSHLRPPILIDNSHNAVAYGKPYQADRHHLDVQRNSLMFAEVADIFAQNAMIDKPFVQSLGAMYKTPRREQQQWRCGQQRKEYSSHAKPQREHSQYGQNDFHGRKINQFEINMRYNEAKTTKNSYFCIIRNKTLKRYEKIGYRLRPRRL